MKKTNQIIIILIMIMYEELIFIINTNIQLNNLILKILFSIQISLFLAMPIFSKNKIIHKLSNLLIYVLPIIYVIQFLYFNSFEKFLSINLLFESSQIYKFISNIFEIIKSNLHIMFLFFIPYYILNYYRKKIKIKPNNLISKMLFIFLTSTFYFLTIMLIKYNSPNTLYSSYNLYYMIDDKTANLNTFGVLTTIRLDCQRKVLRFKEKKLYEYESTTGEKEILNFDNYNMLDIKIKENDNKDLKEIYDYVSKIKPTNKNEYTNYFKDKNVIIILGESFSLLGIDEELTPTLYKLYNSTFKFNNFYTPLYPVSTADGQYISDTSLIPVENLYSIKEVNNKKFPYTFGNAFKQNGYSTFAYHNYNYDYYNRDKYFNTMGFSKYLACGNGLENKMDCSLTYNSDYEMIKASINDYISEDKFLAYYVTMSGHMSYNKTNAMVRKNWNKVKNLNYSDKVKGYLSTQIELDKAIKELIDNLEKNNKLDDTVLILFGDHYPYGLEESEIKELIKNKEVDYYFEKYHMPFIIYNSNTKDTIEINKYCSSLDILPTVLNLFGIKYDSRLLMGKDIFSDEESLVVFSDRSFITNKGFYNSRINKFTSIDNNINSSYIEKVQQEIYLKYRYSRLILENDFYKYLR